MHNLVYLVKTMLYIQKLYRKLLHCPRVQIDPTRVGFFVITFHLSFVEFSLIG